MKRNQWTWMLCGMLALGMMTGTLLADDAKTSDDSNWLAQAKVTETETEKIDVNKVDTAVSETGWEKPIPVSFSIDYTIVSDYMFRGINFSQLTKASNGDLQGGSRKGLNHQLTVGTELDLGDFGRVGGSFWFEWFRYQDQLTPGDRGKNLQEIDYTVYYGYTIDPIGLDVELGFIWYEFPRARGDADSTQEIYTIFSWDDSILWRALGFDCKDPVLNPYMSINWDLDLAKGSSFYEFGLSHDFPLSELGMGDIAILKDTTVGASWAMGWDHNWMNKFSLDMSNSRSNSSHLDYMNWGLNVTTDLKSVFGIPDQYCGDMYVSAFLNYSHAMNRHMLNDYLYGGMSVGYSW